MRRFFVNLSQESMQSLMDFVVEELTQQALNQGPLSTDRAGCRTQSNGYKRRKEAPVQYNEYIYARASKAQTNGDHRPAVMAFRARDNHRPVMESI